jgi:hypothetical protein
MATKFTREALLALQKRIADSDERDARVDVSDPKSKLRARIGKNGVQLYWFRHDRGVKTRIALGQLSDTFSIADAAKLMAGTVNKPLSVLTSRETFGDVAEQYKTRLLKTKRGTEAWADIERNLLPALGRKLVKDVTPRLLREVITEVATPKLDPETGRTVGGPGAGRHAYRHARAILGRALADQAVEHNAATSLSLKELGLSQRRRVRWLNEELVPVFLDNLGLARVLARKALPEGSVSPQVRLALAFLLFVPVRSGSLNGAKVSEFDLKPKKGPPVWRIPAARIKAGTVEQVVPLPPTAVNIVTELKRLAETAKSEYLLFSPADATASIDEKTLTRAFARMERTGRIGPAAGPGEERLVLHGLRASWRSWSQELGLDPIASELLMGHANSALTKLGFTNAAGLYTRSSAIAQQYEVACAVAAKLDTFWKPKPRGKGGKVIQLRSVAS